ncbi:unnamed protein product [Trichogramma brassicae]|uniref:Uncharacterized protein n=1 Tax=Trichogramma brassicae TaxID=86971 RepID=A0A6H5IQ51_9HYME|nr:unnamed protein product [Trichogramma brassicae]
MRCLHGSDEATRAPTAAAAAAVYVWSPSQCHGQVLWNSSVYILTRIRTRPARTPFFAALKTPTIISAPMQRRRWRRTRLILPLLSRVYGGALSLQLLLPRYYCDYFISFAGARKDSAVIIYTAVSARRGYGPDAKATHPPCGLIGIICAVLCARKSTRRTSLMSIKESWKKSIRSHQRVRDYRASKDRFVELQNTSVAIPYVRTRDLLKISAANDSRDFFYFLESANTLDTRERGSRLRMILCARCTARVYEQQICADDMRVQIQNVKHKSN